MHAGESGPDASGHLNVHVRTVFRAQVARFPLFLAPSCTNRQPLSQGRVHIGRNMKCPLESFLRRFWSGTQHFWNEHIKIISRGIIQKGEFTSLYLEMRTLSRVSKICPSLEEKLIPSTIEILEQVVPGVILHFFLICFLRMKKMSNLNVATSQNGAYQ